MSALEQLQDHLKTRAVARAAAAIQFVVADTQQAASRRSGALAQSITGDAPSLAESRVVTKITAAAEYAQYQDEGTGIYGPSGARIFPKTAKVLRFDWPAAGGIVFAKSVAGSPGTHFFSDPMEARWHDSLVAAGETSF